MTIKTSFGKELEIKEPDIIVKDGKLFNKNTNCYEGIDGDRICFTARFESGSKVMTSGTVDGYTYNGLIKIRGVDTPYNVIDGYNIEHIVKVVDYTDENTVVAEIAYAD